MNIPSTGLWGEYSSIKYKGCLARSDALRSEFFVDVAYAQTYTRIVVTIYELRRMRRAHRRPGAGLAARMCMRVAGRGAMVVLGRSRVDVVLRARAIPSRARVVIAPRSRCTRSFSRTARSRSHRIRVVVGRIRVAK